MTEPPPSGSLQSDTIKNIREHDCWDEDPTAVDCGLSLKDREVAIKRMQRPRKEFERGCIIGMVAINNRWSHVDYTGSDPWAKPNPPNVDWRNRVFHWHISKAIRFKTPIPFKGCQSAYRYLNKMPDADKLLQQIVYKQNELLGHRGPRNCASHTPEYVLQGAPPLARCRGVCALACDRAVLARVHAAFALRAGWHGPHGGRGGVPIGVLGSWVYVGIWCGWKVVTRASVRKSMVLYIIFNNHTTTTSPFVLRC